MNYKILVLEIGQSEPPELVELGGLLYGQKDGRTQLFYKDEDNVVTRLTGDAWFTTVRVGGPSGPTIRTGETEPESNVTGNPGDLYIRTAPGLDNANLFFKVSGISDSSGWNKIG